MNNKLGSAKMLGGSGLLLSVMGDLVALGGFFDFIKKSGGEPQEVLRGLFTYIIGYQVNIAGFILFVIAMKYISDVLNDKSIFNNTLAYIIVSFFAVVIPFLGIVGSISVMPRISVMQRDFYYWSPRESTTPGWTIGAIGAFLLLMWIGHIVAVASLKKALDATAQGLNMNLFNLSGILYLVGIITTVILAGAILLFIGKIILMVAFFSIPKRVPSVETVTPSVRPETKYCANCGSRLSSDDKFCPNCGTQVWKL